MEKPMKSVIIALLATTALAAPTFAQNTTKPAQQPQQQSQQVQPQNTQQPAAQPQKQSQAQPQQAPQQNQKQASNQKPIAPNSLSQSQIRQVQAALNKDGFKAGRADGIWGSQTRTALENFQKSKGMTNNGQLTQNTMAALGVNVNAPQQNHG
jgi:peptidoglycan hydrolase-like protein with peptidoglycan-binding domain